VFTKLDKGIFVPTAFIPEGTQFANKRLYIYGKKGTLIKEFSVFDRWGEKVYSRKNFYVNDESEGWDGTFKGKELQSGTYIWHLEAENEDGTGVIYKGIVTLIR